MNEKKENALLTKVFGLEGEVSSAKIYIAKLMAILFLVSLCLLFLGMIAPTHPTNYSALAYILSLLSLGMSWLLGVILSEFPITEKLSFKFVYLLIAILCLKGFIYIIW
jgi:hypothetical protein